MKRVSRATLRGKPLDDDCRKYGRPDAYQYGADDRRCFCTGIWDRMHEDFEPKCRDCSAWNGNAEPPHDDASPVTSRYKEAQE